MSVYNTAKGASYVTPCKVDRILVGLRVAFRLRTAGTIESQANYDRLFAACTDAVYDIGYTVTSSNKADGLIVAEQAVVMGKGTRVGLNTRITKEPKKNIAYINLVAPPMTFTFGDFSENLREYVAAIKRRVPDVKFSSA